MNFRVLLKSSNGSVKEEFWQDKSSQDERLVKMGDVDNFRSLLGSVQSSSVRRPSANVEPDTRIKSALSDELF